MKDAGFALRKAYAVLLADLSYNGKAVKLYDLMAPSKAAAPYIIVGPWQPQSDNTKDSFGQSGEINLDVFTRFGVGIASEKVASDIANAVADLLKPTPTSEVLDVEGFNSYITVIGPTSTITQSTDTDTIIRKILTISHRLCQH